MIDIHTLVDHWWVEGLLDGVENFGEACDKVHGILNVLTNTSLLERIEGSYRHRLMAVKMHDVMRDLALSITSVTNTEVGSPKFFVRTGVGLEKTPNGKEWTQAQRISLMNSQFKELEVPCGLKCTHLTTLLLQGNWKLFEIPELVFEQMHGLRVLNLSNTSIRKLPSSLFNLTNLQGLFLVDCWRLKSLLSNIGQLNRLEVHFKAHGKGKSGLLNLGN